MPLSEKDIEIVEMLAKNEEAVAQLYSAYADRFLEYKDFWSGLAVEEIDHAAELRKLCEITVKGGLYISQGRFNTTAIGTFSSYLEKESAPSRVKEVSLINALSVAVYIEESIIEHKFFDVFETDSVELKQILLNLAAETKRHLEQVRQLWNEHRQSAGG
ncbi:MAG: hypothetical protein JSV54_07210 [Chloroflexota bacterium]|nr:MAG: hypothetical protein JSV54_07210 [Chloroflexota bacterium]